VIIINTNEKHFTLATIYAPNDDDPASFESFFSHLQVFRCDDIILGGDFNLVRNLEKDKKGGLAKTHTKAVKMAVKMVKMVVAHGFLSACVSLYIYLSILSIFVHKDSLTASPALCLLLCYQNYRMTLHLSFWEI